MANRISRLPLSRSHILSFRAQVGHLNQRLPAGADFIQQAAWAGLQDSMPRAALLSIHARVADTNSSDWDHSSLVQLWGPRYSNYVVAAKDLAVFSLGRLPDDKRGRARAFDTASRLHAFLHGRRIPFGKAGHGLGVPPNSLRYAATTGTVLIRWDGARQPDVWTSPPLDVDPHHARIELARRYLHIFGPSNEGSFAKWAGIRPALVYTAFQSLRDTLIPVQTPIGAACILAEDETAIRAQPSEVVSTRFLPSGDSYYLLWNADRVLLVPNAGARAALWTTRVWPGALFVNGEIVGLWRRSATDLSIQAWRRLSSAERQSVEAEALSLPLPDLKRSIVLRWT